MANDYDLRENRNNKKSHKLSRLVFFVILVFFLTTISVIVVDHYLIPYLTTIKGLSNFKLFKKATEDVVVVNKTEQVTVSEDETIAKYSNKSAASVVEIISQVKTASKNVTDSANQQSKTASGLIVTADGLILTYSPGILSDQATYHIFTSNGNEYEARLIAVDSFSNLALLKIDNVSDLSTSSFIAPEDIKVGAKVVAIGRNGGNFQIVYKSGLISEFNLNFSLAGPVASSEKMQGVYFADFEMNNTGDESVNGGTVADYNGNVVGMLGSLKSGNSTQYFIIGANYLENLIEQYISSGMVKRGSLGVYYLNLTKETKYLNSINDGKGALIYSPSNQQGLAVISQSAADKAGLKLNDIIKNVNGEEVNPDQNLAFLISKYKPGDEIELILVRNGQEMKVKVVLG
jgi:serine protease Do